MSFLNLASSAMPGFVGAAQTRRQLEDQAYQRDLEEQARKQQQMDRFLAQRQQQLQLAIQAGDRAGATAAQADIERIQGSGVHTDLTPMFDRQEKAIRQADEDRARQLKAQGVEAFLKVADAYQKGKVKDPSTALSMAEGMGYQAPTKTTKVTKEGPRPSLSFVGPMPPVTSTQTQKVNEFLSVKRGAKSIVDKVDLGDRVRILYSDGTSAIEKKGAVPEVFAPKADPKPVKPTYMRVKDSNGVEWAVNPQNPADRTLLTPLTVEEEIQQQVLDSLKKRK